MSFNRRDLQDDDDDFNFDDDFDFGDAGKDAKSGSSQAKKGDDDFSFDDDSPDINLDDDSPGEFGFEDQDMPELEEDEPAGERRSNRTFVILAAAMIVLFLIGLGVVLFLALQPTGPTPIQQTATAIVLTNNAVALLIDQTSTANAVLALTQTATALTPLPTATAIPTETATPTILPTVDLTLEAQTAIAIQAQRDAEATQTALAVIPPTAEINADSVALTATALASLLAPVNGGQGGGIASPTSEAIGGPVTAIPTALPDTGFFDELGTGSSNLGLLALLALGLVGVIAVSRTARASARK